MRHHVPGAVSAASGFGQSTGHTDLGTITLLFRQPIAGLQILGEDGNWAYVSSDR
jgi:isopenicillin N synthase-like dioxygenase